MGKRWERWKGGGEVERPDGCMGAIQEIRVEVLDCTDSFESNTHIICFFSMCPFLSLRKKIRQSYANPTSAYCIVLSSKAIQ